MRIAWGFPWLDHWSTSASPTAFTIPDATPEGPSAFPFFIILADCLTMSFSDHVLLRCTASCISLRQTIPIPCKLCVQKLLIIIFPSYFHIFSLTANTPSSFLICYWPITSWFFIVVLITVLKISYNISKSFPFFFTFSLINSPPSFFLHLATSHYSC